MTGLDQAFAARLASPLGGGMGRMREVCGAVSGMLLVLGLLYGYDKPGDDSSKKRLHEGKAYHLKWLPGKESRVERIGKPLMLTAPSRYAELDDGEEDEE